MENSTTKDPSSATGRSTSTLLRYPLRSATKSKEEKARPTDFANSTATVKRGTVGSTVSKSVSILDVSGKEKTPKPPRRLSVPFKPNATPAPKSFGNITPTSEARSNRSIGKGDKPVSEVSMLSNRAKFQVLSSASYWLSQIKLSESAAKHSISLGFFKLASEAGCEPMHRMADELKSYVRRYDLSEHGSAIKELFETYNISEITENCHVSESCSQVPVEGNQFSDEEVWSSSSSITDAEKLKPKTPQISTEDVPHTKEPNKRTPEKTKYVGKIKRSATKSSASSKPSSDVQSVTQKKPQKSRIQESTLDKNKWKKMGVKPVHGEAPVKSQDEEDLENKENSVRNCAVIDCFTDSMAALQMEGTAAAEA